MTSYVESFFTTPTFIGPAEEANEWQLVFVTRTYADALKLGAPSLVDSASEREANEKKIAITTPAASRTPPFGEQVTSDNHSGVPSIEYEHRKNAGNNNRKRHNRSKKR